MADTKVVFPACPCPIRARLRRLAASYTFTGCLLPQAYRKGDTARNEDEYRLQASPTSPAKLLMLTQGVWGLLQCCALLQHQLLDLLHELRRPHVFGFLFPTGADVDLACLGLFVADHQQERHFLHGMLADF